MRCSLEVLPQSLRKRSFNLLKQLQIMRLTILLLSALFLFAFASTVEAQNVNKTITFNSVTLPAGSCYGAAGDGSDPVGTADFAILVDCDFGDNSLLFGGDWPEASSFSSPGTVNLGPIYSGFPGFSCPVANLVIGPIAASITTFDVTIEAFESDDSYCEGPYDGVNTGDGVSDDCYGGITNITLDITDGSHSFTVGSGANQITYNYTVTSAATSNTGTICGQNLACEDLDLSYNLIESSGASDDDAILCARSPITFEVTANEGASPYTYKWASSSTTGSILNTLVPPFAGTFTEYVTVTDANSCSSTIAIPFTVNPLPMPIATSNGLVLEGEDFNLMEIGGGVSYWSWSGPNNFSSTLQNPTVYAATKSAEGDYVVTVTNTENCSGTSATSVIVESIADVPTLSEWGLIILALLLMTAGTLYLVQPISSREKV